MEKAHTIDLSFLGLEKTIAAYLLPHASGAALIECGPGSTIPKLIEELHTFGLQPTDISDIFLTHIHLDHGGAAGWFANQGAHIHVHPLGADHLAYPDRLLTSAQRIYGDQMEYLWGKFLPVPEDQIFVHSDGEIIEIEDIHIKVIGAPGHAYHHLIYFFDNICFSGDVGGIRLNNSRLIRLPMPPPDFHLELWRETLKKMSREYQNGTFNRIAPTHYGIHNDADWHLKELQRQLNEIELWIDRVMPVEPGIEELNELFLAHTREQSQSLGLTDLEIQALEAANPSWMAAGGIHRYWHKVRVPSRAKNATSE